MIGEAVFARCLSSQKEERVAASKVTAQEIRTHQKNLITFFLFHNQVLPAGVTPDSRHLAEIAARVEDLRHAVYASKLVSYAQGFQLLRAASEENNWSINFGSCALMWRGNEKGRKRYF